MLFEQKPKETYLYLDKNILEFSNLATGLVVNAMGDGLKIAYVSYQLNSKKFINFIENISLDNSFVKNLNNFKLDFFSFLKNDKVLKSMIPQVEYLNLSQEIFWNLLESYDLIIFDNICLDFLDKIKLLGLLKNKNYKSQIVFITSLKSDFDVLKLDFNNSFVINYLENISLNSFSNLISICGTNFGASFFAIGYLLNKYLYKNQTKLVYFNQKYVLGNLFFFSNLKKWSKFNNFYGDFDFLVTGFNENKLQNYYKNFYEKEANLGFDLLETILKKKNVVLGINFLDVLNKNLILESKVLDLFEKLKNCNNDFLVTGNFNNVLVDKFCKKKIEFEKV